MSDSKRQLFGAQLLKCRRVGHLTQRKIAEKLHRHPSALSKLEGGKFDIALPSQSELNILIRLLREHDVPENDLTVLQHYWEAASQEQRPAPGFDEPVARLVTDALKDRLLNPIEADAIREDIGTIIWLWRGYLLTREAFRRSELTYGQAAEQYKDLVEGKEFRLGARLEVRLRLELGRHFRYLGNSNAAARNFQEALSIAERLHPTDVELHAKAFIEIGDVYRRLEGTYWSLALQSYEKAGRLLESIKGEQIKHEVERKKANVFLNAGLPKEALIYCIESLDAARRTPDRDGERKALEHHAWALRMLGQLDDALDLQLEAFKIAKELSIRPTELAKCHRHVADAYLACGMLDDAEMHYNTSNEWILRSRARMRQNGHEDEKLIRGRVLLGLSSVLARDADRRSSAYELAKESLEIHDSLREVLAIARSLMVLGELYLLDDRLDEAQEYFRQAEWFLERAGFDESSGKEAQNPYYMSLLRLIMAKLELSRLNPDKARIQELTDSATKDAIQFGFSGHQARALLIMAEARLFNTRKDEHPLDYYRQALEICLPLSRYLTRETLVTVRLHLGMLRNHNVPRVIDLSNLILHDWSELIQRARPGAAEELQNWLSVLARDHLIWQTSAHRNSSSN